MREGRIDLDYLDSEIEKLKRDIEKSKKVKGTYPAYVLFQAGLTAMEEIRSKCTPIEPPVFLSKTCINNWESNQYCEKSGACEMCKLK